MTEKNHTLQDFHNNAVDDYLNTRENYNQGDGPSLKNWQFTVFVLTNKEKNIQIKISVKESILESDEEELCSTYLICGSENTREYNMTLAEKTKAKLDAMFIC